MGDLLSFQQVKRRALGHDPATALSALGAEIDHPVGLADDLQVVLDDKDRVAAIDEFLQHLKQFCDIGQVQPRRRLVQDVEGPARTFRRKG